MDGGSDAPQSSVPLSGSSCALASPWCSSGCLPPSGTLEALQRRSRRLASRAAGGFRLARTRSVVSPRQREASSYAISAPPSSFVPATVHVRAPGRALLLLLLLLTVVPPVTQAAATRKTSSRRSSSRLLVALPTVLSPDSSSALEVRHSCLFCLCAVLRICCLSGPDLTDPKARLPPHIGFVCVFLYAALLTMVLREAERDVTPLTESFAPWQRHTVGSLRPPETIRMMPGLLGSAQLLWPQWRRDAAISASANMKSLSRRLSTPNTQVNQLLVGINERWAGRPQHDQTSPWPQA